MSSPKPVVLDGLAAEISEKLTSSALLAYREEMCGARDTAAIEKHTDLMLAMRGVNQPKALKAFAAVAANRDSDWKLGPEEKKWSEKQTRRARAMRRDIDQALL
eukprot:4327482-Pyramimonas_sp.AAC.1